jgi:pseudouridine kinase
MKLFLLYNFKYLTISSGAAVGDLAAKAASYPGQVRQACGGVGRNVAEVVARLGVPHRLLTAIGADEGGRFLRTSLPQLRWDSAMELQDLRTAHYVALLSSDGHLQFGVADMAIHDAIDADFLRSRADLVAGAKVVCCDVNTGLESLCEVSRLCSEAEVPLWFDATDVLKATKLLDIESRTACASVNVAELSAMLEDARIGGTKEEAWLDRLTSAGDSQQRSQVIQDLMTRCDLLGSHFKELLVKLGPHGALLWPQRIWCAAPEAENIVSVSGAGDSFLGAFLVSRYAFDQSLEASLWAGMRAAEASLSTHLPISASLQASDFRFDALQGWAEKLETKFL